MTKHICIGLAMLLLLTGFLAMPVMAQDRMTYEEYLVALDREVQREQEALRQIETLEAEMAGIRAGIAQIEADEAAVWQSIYDMLNILESDLQPYRDDLAALEQEINQLATRTPAELNANMEEIESLQERFEEVAGRDISLLTENWDRIDRMRDNLEAVHSRAESYQPPSRQYTVVRGDCLWGIAGMRQHYNDPMKWMRIYSFNADQIDNPDLIFANQRFTIPMAVDRSHYLVQSGDFLYSIAQSIYGDPFQWRRLYESNNGFIEDPNTIYPEMILALPGR